jgi:exodeoxyribonuclease VII large subunit
MSQPSLDLEYDEPDDGGLPTFTVGELVAEVNAVLRRRFYEGVWVRGEIQGFKDSANGHAYFNLVEESDAGKATIAVSWFNTSRQRLRPLLQRHRLRLGDGLKVRIHGYLDMYAPTGRLGLKMSGIDPRYTLGELAMQRDDVVRRLVAAGLYDANRARVLAAVPLSIGVVTSVGSAAWHDFTQELASSGIGFRLHVVDVRVQGVWAVPMVSSAIRQLAAMPGLDALVLVRGGGARTDLAAFDAEEIATAIATAPVPVLTGLGHEIDSSVADDIAYRSLKTPTACAGALIERVRTFSDRAERTWSGVAAVARGELDAASAVVTGHAHRIAGRTHAVLERAEGRLAVHAGRIPLAASSSTVRAATEVAHATARLGAAARRHLATAAIRLDGIDGRVGALDPALTLARGWSITRTSEGRLVRSRADAPPGTNLVTTVSDGEIGSVTNSTGGRP